MANRAKILGELWNLHIEIGVSFARSVLQVGSNDHTKDITIQNSRARSIFNWIAYNRALAAIRAIDSIYVRLYKENLKRFGKTLWHKHAHNGING